MIRLSRLLPHFALTAFSLFSIQPLLRRQMLCSDDAASHLYRAVALEALIGRGHIFPRWSPEMAHGFGYPAYNFYASLTSYVLVALHSLGFTYPAALYIAFGLSIWLSGLAVFALVRQWWGEAGGIAAGVVYLTAPYLAFDVLFRGALAESFAWVWPPLILLALDRALVRPYHQSTVTHHQSSITQQPSLRWPVVAAVAYTGLMLTHNAVALVASPLIAGYVIFLALRGGAGGGRVLALGALILAAGLALGAYFWIPALGERSLVQSDRLLVPPIFTYYTNFLTPAELFAAPRAADPLLLNPSPPRSLGLTAALLALAGVATLSRRAVRASGDAGRILFFAGGLVVYALMTLPLSRPLWDHLPLAPYLQFPWRMLMPAALCAAILAGAAVKWWAAAPASQPKINAIRHTPQIARSPWLVVAFVSTIAVLGNLSWWYPRYCGPFVEETISRMLRYEYDSYTVGTSAKAEFLPRTVRSLPDDDSVASALQRGVVPDRLRDVPEGATVVYRSRDPLALEFRVTTPRAFDLTYQMFDYAGWTARVDGVAVPIVPTPEHGLIRFALPAGAHDISIRFGSTPLRTGANAMSVLTGFGLLLLLVSRSARPTAAVLESQAAIPTSQSLTPDFRFAIRNLPFLTLLLALCLFALKVLWIDRTTNIFRRSHFSGAALSIGTPINQPLSGGLFLLSYENQPAGNPQPLIPRPHTLLVESGGDFDTLLYLTARAGGTVAEYRPKFTLVSTDGTVWNRPDAALPPRWQREPPSTNQWPPGEYAQWARRETVLPGTPPGRYRLVGTIFDLATLVPDSLMDENGNPVSPNIDLGEIVVTRPTQAGGAHPATLDMQYRSGEPFGAGLTLLGYNLDRAEARPGDTMLVTLFWRADETPGADVQALLSLEGDSGERAFTTSFPPVSESFPTTQWRAGDVWRGQHFVRLPAGLAAGAYRWNVALGEGGAEAALGSLRVGAPDRVFTALPFDTASAARFGEFAELVGYSLAPRQAKAGEVLSLTLIWRALATPDADYSAFVHLSDASGRIWAQSDAVPANWARPTTGWLAGEYVGDTHVLPLPGDLPPGEYWLSAGMADVQTGARAAATGPGALDDGRARLGVLTIRP